MELKSKILSALFWKFMERGGTQGVQFIVQVVLARLLLPEDYGLIALVTIFIILANIFVQSGFNTALIQKKDATETDFSSVFYLSLFVSGIMYVILFFAAPFIAVFFELPQLTTPLRISSITLFLGAFNSIQNAVVARSMQFKKLFFSSLGAILISGTVGIAMAYAGLGVWALIGLHITNQAFITVILLYTVNWRPRLLFSFARVKGLFSYGWKLSASSLIDNMYNELRGLVIGKMFNAEMLGFYNKGRQFPSLIVTNINGSIQSVMLPALSSQQENKQRVKDMVRRSIITSSFILFPIMIGLAVVAEPLVKIVLTEKWLPIVPFLQIYCVTYSLWPIHTANLQAINALGRSDIFLKLEIIKKVIGLVILGVTVFHGVYAIAFGGVISGLISTVINSYPNIKLLNYSYKEQWKDITPSLILSIIMGFFVYSVYLFSMAVWVTLIMQIIVGIVLYLGLAKIFKLECFTYLLLTGKDFFRSREGIKV